MPKACLCVILYFVWAGYPVSAQQQVFWGDVHGHTRLSDGKKTLNDYFSYARDVSKLDFVIVTDHDFGNGKPSWHMTKSNWLLTQNRADKFTVNGKFIGIAGYEWTSQPKYWTEVGKNKPSERLFKGPPKFYDHKNVYFPSKVDYIFSAKNPAYNSPDLLAEAVRRHGGLIHTNHPGSDPQGKSRWDYDPGYFGVIANTEIGLNQMRYKGKIHHLNFERNVRRFLNSGGKTGFVGGSDTHEGKPVARTAVLAEKLTREAIFDALRHRRNYAISSPGSRIILNFEINGHGMGEEIEINGKPNLAISVRGTASISEIAVIRDGNILFSFNPATVQAEWQQADESFMGNSYYYLRVTQTDQDEHGNYSRAWSSPIWVKRQNR